MHEDEIEAAVDRALWFIDARWALITSSPPRRQEPLTQTDLEEVMTQL